MKTPTITSFLIAVSAFMIPATPACGASSVKDAINKTKDAATTSKKTQSEAQKAAREREETKAKAQKEAEADAKAKAEAEAKANEGESKKSELAASGTNTATDSKTNSATTTPGQRPIPKTPEEFTDWLCEKLNSTPAERERILKRFQKSYKEAGNSMRNIVGEAASATGLNKKLVKIIEAEGWHTNMYSTREWLEAEEAAKDSRSAQSR